jgi:hypothetical protein
MPNDNVDPSNERTRIDTAVYREIPLGELSVDAQGRITIQRLAKTDTPANAYNATRAPVRPKV